MQRGIEVILGSKKNLLGLRLSTLINNTMVRNYLDCNSSSIVLCEGLLGSVYDSSDPLFTQATVLSQFNVS